METADDRVQFWIPERRRTQVLARTQDIGIARYQHRFAEIEAALRDLERRHPGL